MATGWKYYKKESSKFRLRILLSAVLLAFLFLVFIMGKGYLDSKRPAGYWNPAMPENLLEAKVAWVSDGDTVICNLVSKDSLIPGSDMKIELNESNEFTLRLIGLDAPESVHPDEEKNTEEGKAASAFVREKLQGKKVYLEFDNQIKDKYGRYLAYVWIEGELFNKRILEEGHGELLIIPPNDKYEEILEKAYEDRKGA